MSFLNGIIGSPPAVASGVSSYADYDSLPSGVSDGTVAMAATKAYAYFAAGDVWVPADWYWESGGVAGWDFLEDGSSNPCDINPDSTVAGIEAAGWSTVGASDTANGILIDNTSTAGVTFGTAQASGLTKTGIVLQVAVNTGTSSGSWRPQLTFNDSTKEIQISTHANQVANRIRWTSAFNAEDADAEGVINFTDYDTIFMEVNHSVTEGSGICRVWNANSNEQTVIDYAGLSAVGAGTYVLRYSYGSFINTSDSTIKRLQAINLA